MISRLLSDEFPSEIGTFIHKSEYSYINREFEYIFEFELRCLEQFNICKSLYDSLQVWEKDEVIKYWVKQLDWHFDEEVTFSQLNIKNFDLISFNDLTPKDEQFNELNNTDPYPTFYTHYYILKFKNLLITFFINEEHYNLEKVKSPNYKKQEFNPKEYLNLPDITSPSQIVNEIILPTWTQKVTVCFFQILRDSHIRPKGLFSNKQYCQLLCQEFNIQYKEKMAKLFSHSQDEEIDKVKIIILPALNNDIKTKLENYLENARY
jgi:hypothetical protein